jgi:hypothetical protein
MEPIENSNHDEGNGSQRQDYEPGEDENVNDSGDRVSGLAILKNCEF